MKSPRRSTESLAVGARKGVATYDRLEAEGAIGSVYGVAVGPRSLASCGGSGSGSGTGCPGGHPGTRGSRLLRSNASSPRILRGGRSTSAAGPGRTRGIWPALGGLLEVAGGGAANRRASGRAPSQEEADVLASEPRDTRDVRGHPNVGLAWQDRPGELP